MPMRSPICCSRRAPRRRNSVMPIKTINNGSAAPPRLRLDLNAGTLLALPPDSAGPSGFTAETMTAVKAAGYEGVQAIDPTVVLNAGLRATCFGRVLRPAD